MFLIKLFFISVQQHFMSWAVYFKILKMNSQQSESGMIQTLKLLLPRLQGDAENESCSEESRCACLTRLKTL